MAERGDLTSEYRPEGHDGSGVVIEAKDDVVVVTVANSVRQGTHVTFESVTLHPYAARRLAMDLMDMVAELLIDGPPKERIDG